MASSPELPRGGTDHAAFSRAWFADKEERVFRGALCDGGDARAFDRDVQPADFGLFVLIELPRNAVAVVPQPLHIGSEAQRSLDGNICSDQGLLEIRYVGAKPGRHQLLASLGENKEGASCIVLMLQDVRERRLRTCAVRAFGIEGLDFHAP